MSSRPSHQSDGNRQMQAGEPDGIPADPIKLLDLESGGDHLPQLPPVRKICAHCLWHEPSKHLSETGGM
jgi:hypothetical protein